ncbi:MAG: cell envelope integrity protein CreD [Bacteroidia bacterium]
MLPEPSQIGPEKKTSSLIRNSITVKLITITALMLLLLIPAYMIQGVIQEREQLSKEATQEVSAKWANAQQINGPILTIPVVYEKLSGTQTITTKKYWHVLPDELNIDGEILPEKLKRGIYEVVVYKSDLKIAGNFTFDSKPDPEHLKEIQYDQAFLTIGISDLRGIKNQINVNWAGNSLEVNAGSKASSLIRSGISVSIPNLAEQLDKKIAFDFAVNLQGSRNISFIPVGNTTNVKMQSPWQSPSFNGNFLPDNRDVTEQGFTADWSVLQLNRNYPQSWLGNAHLSQMLASSLGVDLILPLDDYQKSYRSAKYAVMTIALTFLIFFLVEILNKKKIHPFQYALVGLALCVFYILMVSISEHSNFNVAYGISTITIIAMISLYSLSVFKKISLSLLLVATLIGIYGFLFVTLQLADFALLMGSVGLVCILGLTMYFTRNIDWYGLSVEKE